MKKIFLILILLFFPCFAHSIPQNIDEYLGKSYIGLPYNSAIEKDLPFLLIFANPNDIVSLAKLSSVGEMVYKEFKGQYNFCIINVKVKENKELTASFAPQKLPALYIIDPKEYTYTFIDNKYYKKRELREILTKFKNGTLF